MCKVLFCCPICKHILQYQQKSLQCCKGHSFDIAKEGYVHLLPVQKKRTKNPGDHEDMVFSRHRFLQTGAYQQMAKTLAELCVDATKTVQVPFVLDAGCGEGYYTKQVSTALSKVNQKYHMAAYDISKSAVKLAARQAPQVQFAVASSASIPIADQQADCILNIFSPMATREFLRVLKPNGILIFAVPGKKHLWQLKEILYEIPYENKIEDIVYEGFVLKNRVSVEDNVCLTNTQIQDVFTMTPYYWKTPKEGAERLKNITHLTMQIAFDFVIYQKQV